METPGVSVDTANSDAFGSDNLSSGNSLSPRIMSRSSSSRRTTTATATATATASPSFPVIRFLQAPVTTVLEYSGVLRPRSNSDYRESESLIHDHRHHDTRSSSDSDTATSSNNGDNGEVSIRIIGAVDPEEQHGGEGGEPVVSSTGESDGGDREMADSSDVDGEIGRSESHSDSSYQQRYDMQQVSRWIEQILPFSLLLLIVFIRQHLQGFFVTIYVTAFMYKSNDILRKQTALKGERRLSVLAGYFIVFILHVIGVYWWYQNDDLCYPLFMVPPRAIPPFWHAIFTILVNDTMVRQTAMAFKLVLLMYYKNGKGHNFRRQGQMLTVIEYALLLYRAFLPAPVWYRFFLNKEYGSLFSSLTTGLYLTFKLTSIVEKVLIVRDLKAMIFWI